MRGYIYIYIYIYDTTACYSYYISVDGLLSAFDTAHADGHLTTSSSPGHYIDISSVANKYSVEQSMNPTRI
jgi:hypothetical protein